MNLGGVLASTCILFSCRFLPHSVNAAPPPLPGSHVLVTSTTPTLPTTTALNYTTTAPVSPAIQTAVALANISAGIENATEWGGRDPFVHSFIIHSDIKYRYSRVEVSSAVVNPSRNKSHEVTFNVTLPEKAFIFKFSMTIDGEVYSAYVDDRTSAREAYDVAQREGKSAALVESDARNSNGFHIKTNVEASTAVIFTLTYEELLERQHDHYEQVIHIDSETANNCGIVVTIADTQNITMLRAVGRERQNDQDKTLTGVDMERDGPFGILAWSPNMTSKTGRKIPGRFIVQYDVHHNPGAGQILVRDGYFVHFFSPQAPVIPKHIIFVLDVSGSMSWGGKITQLREAMLVILDDLAKDHPNDFFNIISFSSGVTNWNPRGSSTSSKVLDPYSVTHGNIRAAKDFISSLRASGGTNIRDALTVALNQAAAGPSRLPRTADPIIMFLTDGVGNRPAADTRVHINALNQAQRVPIFSLAFGKDADFPSLKVLSLQNNGLARRIYQDSDAAMQLENFYAEIASPVLSGVDFTYTSDLYDVSGVTRSKFPRFFKGTELIVAGKIKPVNVSSSQLNSWWFDEEYEDATIIGGNQTAPSIKAIVHGTSSTGISAFDAPEIFADATDISDVTFPGTKSLFQDNEDEFFLERLWAYLTVKQLLDEALAEAEYGGTSFGSNEDYVDGEDDPKSRAFHLAIQYKFVTPLTSLVVVRPDDSTYKVVPPCDVCDGFKPKSGGVTAVGKSVNITGDPHTLNGISWLSLDDIWVQVGARRFLLARDGSDMNVIPSQGLPCGSQRNCTHLKDCVLPEFAYDFKVYQAQYFCEMISQASPSSLSYAGTCCPLGHKG